MSGHASDASEDLPAQNCLDSDNKRTLPHDVEQDADIHSQSYGEPGAQIPSKSERKPRLKKILTESERGSDAESDDGQQRLPGPSLYGEKPLDSDNKRIPSEIEREPDAELDAEPDAEIEREPDGQQNIREEYRHLGPSPHATIYKIPNILKDTKREAYVPQRVSLGPYHHGIAELSSMDHYKRGIRRRLLRFDFYNDARNAILRRVPEIKACYEGSIEYNENDLCEMVMMDGRFIVQVLDILARSEFQPGKLNTTYFNGNIFAASNTVTDILMLENQVPWFVLEELKNEECVSISFSMMKKVTFVLFKISLESRWLESAVQKAPHLLGFLHNVIVEWPSDKANPQHRISIGRCVGGCVRMLSEKNKALNDDFESIPPALELKSAGIKFRAYNGGMMYISFEPDSSTIYLPRLLITYDTEVLFRNLMAFEMCRPSQVNYVSSYLNLLDDLIDSKKDVAFLRTTGILINLLGSDEEVADLFNGLFKGVTLRMPYMFDGLKRLVNVNYKNRIRVQLAELCQDHFSSPWKTIALAVAFAILCLTITQTIYTVKQYLQGKK